MNTDKEIAIEKARYRESLLQLYEKMQGAYDKTVLTLASGSFGVSVLIVKELVGRNAAKGSICLTFAWMLWGFSILAVLYSFFPALMRWRNRLSILTIINQSLPNLAARQTCGHEF